LSARLGRRRFFTIFATAIVGLLGAGLLSIVLARPGAPKPACEPGKPCVPHMGPPALLTGRVWRSDLGLQMEYYPDIWHVQRRGSREVRLQASGPAGKLQVWLTVVPAGEAGPEQLAKKAVDDLRSRAVPTLAVDTRPADKVLGPAIGHLDGTGASYSGVVDTPQGPGLPIEAFVLASSDRRVTASALVTTTFPRDTSAEYTPWPELQFVDWLLNTVRWPTQSAPASPSR
jgi:hypothetical protein